MAFAKFTPTPVTGQTAVMPLPRPANLAQMRARQAELSSAKPAAKGNLPSDALPAVAKQDPDTVGLTKAQIRTLNFTP